MNPQRLFIVDVESSGRTPYSSVMTEFGVVDFLTRESFHGHLWDFTPHPDNPALPVPSGAAPHPGYTLDQGKRIDVADVADVYELLTDWLTARADGGRITFVSDNPAFDFMWMADGFDRAGMANPFGHTGRRIGDLAAGLTGKWRQTSAWKRKRVTAHDHTPVNDALGNAEALHALLLEHHQIDA